LAQTGAVAGGATALAGSVALILTAIATDLGMVIDSRKVCEKYAGLGALFGVCYAFGEQLL
jgi:hypothetical protein